MIFVQSSEVVSYLPRGLKGGRGLALGVPVAQVPRHVEVRDGGDRGALAEHEGRDAAGVVGLDAAKVGQEGQEVEKEDHFHVFSPQGQNDVWRPAAILIWIAHVLSVG